MEQATPPLSDAVSDEAEWQQNREAILVENSRKKKTYEDQVTAGQERSAALNRRFANWYYVISDATYQEIHLTMKDLIEQKPPAESSDGAVKLPSVGQDPLDQLRNIVPPSE